MPRDRFILALGLGLAAVMARSAVGETFRVATYNLENYVLAGTGKRKGKSEESKAKIRESLLAISPDVIALQEMGGEAAVRELRDSLSAAGLLLPYWEMVGGHDTNVQVAVLSRWPIVASRARTNEMVLVGARRYAVSRGFAEVDIRVSTNYAFTLMAAHLKSKRVVAQVDEGELRLAEARALRERIEAALFGNAETNLVVVGDFNDTPDSEVVRVLIGRGRGKLVDTRPGERSGGGGDRMRGDPGGRLQSVGGSLPGRARLPAGWTEYYSKADTYNRVDYILVSPGMAREWVAGESYVLALPDWSVASDHRPVVVTFEAAER